MNTFTHKSIIKLRTETVLVGCDPLARCCFFKSVFVS